MKVNGQTIAKIICNGTEIKKAYCNGALVFEKYAPPDPGADLNISLFSESRDWVYRELKRKANPADEQICSPGADLAEMVSQLENIIAQIQGGETRSAFVFNVQTQALCDICGQACTTLDLKSYGIPIILISYNGVFDEFGGFGDALSYYITPDYYGLGTGIGEKLTRGFADGSAADSASLACIECHVSLAAASMRITAGLTNTLQPYIDAGQITLPNGELNLICGTTEENESFMDALMQTDYPDGTAIDSAATVNCCRNEDGIAVYKSGIWNAMQANGITSETSPIHVFEDCVGSGAALGDMLTAAYAVNENRNTFTLNVQENLADKLIAMIQAIEEDREADVNDTESFYNGAIIVPAVCVPVTVTEEA